jgi:hypothetical protein
VCPQRAKGAAEVPGVQFGGEAHQHDR